MYTTGQHRKRLHLYRDSSSDLTRRKSLAQAGPIPAATFFSTPSRPSASLSCTLIVFPSAEPHELAMPIPASVLSHHYRREKLKCSKSPYRVCLYGTKHNLLSISCPPSILDSFRNPQLNVSTSNPTHPRRPNQLREETRRHHRSFGPLVILYEKSWANDGPVKASGLAKQHMSPIEPAR